MTVHFDEHAEEEYLAAIAFYERDYPRGERLRNAVDATLAAIEREPFAFPERLGKRVAIVQRFPYVLFFEMRDTTLRVLAVAHAKRRPGYWRAR